MIRKPLEIRLDDEAGRLCHLYLNGNLAGEIAFNRLTTRDELLAKVAGARAAAVMPEAVACMVDALERSVADGPDHVHKTAAARREAFVRGLLDGLKKTLIPHGEPHVPPIKPDCAPSYERGYDAGEAIRRCADIIGRAALGEAVEADGVEDASEGRPR